MQSPLREHLPERGIIILCIFQSHPGTPFISASATVVMFETELIFRLTRTVIHNFRIPLIVPAVLFHFIVQTATAQYEQMMPIVAIMPKRSPHGVTPLLTFGQIIQQVFLTVVRVFHIGVQ